MTITTLPTLTRMLAVAPLLALTACAGSQRFGGGPGAAGAPSYSQPALQSAPPVTSSPVTSQPLPPPGGYPVPSPETPVATAPGASGTLPPPQDPFFQPTPPASPAQPPTLSGGGGQVATLGQPAAPANPARSRDSVVGGWTAREATGGSCRVTLSSSPALDLYRATASGCSNRDLQKVNAWDYRDGEVYLYQQGGSVVARLRASDAGSMSGAITKSGASLSMAR